MSLWAGIDESRPYNTAGMTSAKWRELPVERVAIRNLILSQSGVSIEGLLRDQLRPGVGGDMYPHAVEQDGRLYLEDGHHRLALALLRGETHIRCRVLRR